MTPRKFLSTLYPTYEEKRKSSEKQYEFTEKMMEKYADYKTVEASEKYVELALKIKAISETI